MYQGEILDGPDGNMFRAQREPILTNEEYEAVTAKWKPDRPASLRLRAIGKGRYRVPAVPVRPVREMQFANARRTPQR